MFTQCYKCETVFRLSARALRTAHGQVRCGHCGDVFDALSRLADDASGYGRGETSLDMEVRVDELLATAEESTTPQPAAAQTTELSQLQVLQPPDDVLTSEASLEFTLPPGELDRIFIETTPSVLKLLSVEANRQEQASSSPAPTARPPAAPEFSEVGTERPQPAAAYANAASSVVEFERPKSAGPPTASAEDVFERPLPELGAFDAFPADAAAAANANANANAADADADADAETDADAERAPGISGLEISDDALKEMLAGIALEQQPIAKTRRRGFKFAWLTAAIVLALLLVAQIMVANRDWWAAYVPLLGGAVAPYPNLAAYQLRQWGASGDPGGKGTLRVRASILNTAAQLEPYPLLRVTVANRYGTRIARREFEPAEYLGKGTSSMLGLGERAEATLDILDPGMDAEGFELDVCLRGTVQRLVCAADAGTRAQ